MPARRYYIIEDGRKVTVPSVTTVLSHVGDKGGLMNWQFQQGKAAMRLELEEDHEPINSVWSMPKSAAEIGTVVHAMIECWCHGIEFDRSLYSEDILGPADQAYEGWLSWVADQQLTIEATEESLTSQVGRYGGTLDVVWKTPSKRVLADFKTGGIYPEHVVQLAAYAGLWAEHHQDKPLDAIAVLGINKSDGSFRHQQWDVGSKTFASAVAAFVAARAWYEHSMVLKKAV